MTTSELDVIAVALLNGAPYVLAEDARRMVVALRRAARIERAARDCQQLLLGVVAYCLPGCDMRRSVGEPLAALQAALENA